VVPFYDEHDIRLCRVLTDRGTEYCGNPERHEYELYLAVEDVDIHAPGPNGPKPRMRLNSPFFQTGVLSSPCAWVTARRRAGHEVKALPRSLH